MKKGIAKRSSLFLLEIIIAILFFALASTVCIQLFVKSHTLVTKTGALDMAVNQVQNMAESIRGIGGTYSLLPVLYPDAETEESCLLLYYDKEYNSMEHDFEKASYRMKVTPSQEDAFFYYSIEMIDLVTSKPVYKLNLKIYDTSSGGGAVQ